MRNENERQLLTKDPKKRLGGGPTDAEEVKKHPFFRSIDWKKLYEKDLPVPFVGLEWIYDTQLPEVKSKEDTSQFSAEFTNLPIVSPSSYNRPYTEEISFHVTMKNQMQNQGVSYGPYARVLANEEPGPRHLGSDSDDNSYVSASVSEYSDDDMMEDQYLIHLVQS